MVGTPAQSASRDWAVVHYQRPAGGYADWGLYTWGDIDPAYATEWPKGQPFAGEDSYGRFAWVKLKPGAKSVGFLVVDTNGTKDVAQRPHHRRDPDRRGLAQAGRPGASTRPGRPPPASRTRRSTRAPRCIHYRRADGNYDGWGLHLWDGAANPTDWSSPLQAGAGPTPSARSSGCRWRPAPPG